MEKLKELIKGHLNNDPVATHEAIYEVTKHRNDNEVDRLLRQAYHDWDVCPKNQDELVERYAEWITEATNK